MQELLDAIASPVNLALTVLLGLAVLYWLLVIFGALTIDALDFDMDGPGDLPDGGDIDLPAHGTDDLAHAAMSLSWLRFFNVGTVPLMFLLSIFLLMLWLAGVILHPVIGAWGVLFQILLLVPMALAAALITKVLTMPLATIFRRMREQEEAERRVVMVGQRARVVSTRLTDRYGQVEVETNGSPLRLNARVTEAGQELKRGDEVILVAEDEQGKFFIVRGL
ncbi:MAG: hypothetical protein WD042_15380 [Phycisphaeraceae bacterium]